MAYDEETAARFRAKLAGLEGLSEKKMMGGVCFLLNGNMVGGADKSKDGERRFMMRVGKDNHDDALKLPHAQPMDMGGRKMSGFFWVNADMCADEQLAQWVALALSFVTTLPAK